MIPETRTLKLASPALERSTTDMVINWLDNHPHMTRSLPMALPVVEMILNSGGFTIYPDMDGKKITI